MEIMGIVPPIQFEMNKISKNKCESHDIWGSTMLDLLYYVYKGFNMLRV